MKKFVLFIALGIFLLFAVIQGWVGFQNIIEYFFKINIVYIPLILLIPFIVILICGVRWNMLLNSLKIETNWKSIFKSVFIGNMVANITPVSRFGGEPVKAYVISEDLGVQKRSVFASVVTDSMLESFSVMLLSFFAVLTLVSFRADMIIFFGLLGIFFGAMFFFLFIIYNEKTLMKFSRKIAGLVARFSKKHARKIPASARKFRKQFKNIENNRVLITKTFALSLVERLVEVIGFYIIVIAMGIPFDLVSSAMVIGTGALAGTIPLLPGGLVLYESSSIMALQVLGIPATMGTALILIWRATMYGILTITGAIVTWVSSAKLMKLMR